MAKLPAWCVAAAVLLKEDKELHNNQITDRVLRSQLSGLGRDGSTPEQTMGAAMRERKDIFVATGEGRYWLRNPSVVEKMADVRAALQSLDSPRTSPPPSRKAAPTESSVHKNTDADQKELTRLRSENIMLKNKLQRILGICRDS